MTGKRFGRLTVLKFSGTDTGGRTKWLCRCDCGNEKIIDGYKIRSGNTQSCGCYQAEMRGKSKITHGMTNSRLYSIWCGMKARCTNPKNPEYGQYGGRGIKICSEWQQFENFAVWAFSNGYSDELSIDRINVNGNYSPQNCRWATSFEQQNNKQYNHKLTVYGITHTIAEWAQITGLKYDTIERRVNAYGWNDADAVLTPVHCRG